MNRLARWVARPCWCLTPWPKVCVWLRWWLEWYHAWDEYSDHGITCYCSCHKGKR